MGSSARDVIQGIGDAISGVDRNKTWLEGQELGARIGEQRSRTEEAMAAAREKRTQAEILESKKAALERLRAAQSLTDPNNVPIGDLITSGGGGDYAAAMEGRNRGQQFNERETVETPAPLGDVAGEARREAALEALSPGSALAQRGGRGAPVIALDPDNPQGPPIYTTPQRATGEGLHPAPKPATPTGPTSQQKNVDDLVKRGVPHELAIRIVYNKLRDPKALYQGVLTTQMRNFVDQPTATAAARKAVSDYYGEAALSELGTDQPLIQNDEEGGLPHGIPAGSNLIGHTKAGAEVYQTPDGRKLVSE